MLKQISPLPGQTRTVEGWAKPVGPEVVVSARDREEVLSAVCGCKVELIKALKLKDI